ncbi:MAG: aminoglycoside phosphotransferase family protein [Flavobacteriaceae bacterium]|nr:aminoglycoside phosphotransferase family protein [Flavobacteriaceae bacterium]
MNHKALKLVWSHFQVSTKISSILPINQGYINDTFLITDSDNKQFILQRINAKVFKNIDTLHQNFHKALQKLKGEDYTEISLIPTQDKALVYIKNDNYWRMLTYIKNSDAFNYTKDPKIAFEAGKILGKFHTLLSKENPKDFDDIISNLNHLPSKITEFETALANTSTNRKEIAKHLIAFAQNNKTLFNAFYQADLPLRICHNDTKLNNMLFDKTTKQGLCFIDLDTIMKGYFHYDFGDAIRTVVSESNEDEKVLENIKFNRTLFENFVEGLENYKSMLTPKEIDFLPISCALMPFMHGLRALTDYLNGNIYYKVSNENQNLDRCQSLFEFTKKAINEQQFIEAVIKSKLV